VGLVHVLFDRLEIAEIRIPHLGKGLEVVSSWGRRLGSRGMMERGAIISG
jgi:hypothetical protein